MNFKNSAEFAIPDSLSHLKYLGIPNGFKIVVFTASIISEACLDFIACNCMYPVNMSTARKIALFPFSVGVREGIISTAQLTLGAKTISIGLNV